MPRKNAPSNNPEGRPAGSKNRRTVEWEQLGGFITEAGAKRVMEYLNAIEDDEEFFNKYERLLNYFKPKMATTQNQHSGDITFKGFDINIIRQNEDSDTDD